MKICFYSPYIPKHQGGGEKHFFDVALALAAQGHTVEVALSPTDFVQVDAITKKYENFLNHSLAHIHFVVSPLFSGSFLHKLMWTYRYDALYYVTDGSLFFSAARKNYLHVQVPLLLDKSSIIERLKLLNWQSINTNSVFTKEVIEKSWNVKVSMVLNPTVTIPKKLTHKKEKIILNVGRFFTQLHAKRQDVLIAIFKEMCTRHPREMKDWSLVLIGHVEDEAYYAALRAQAAGLNVIFVPNASHQEVKTYYKKAQIYWHATGFDIKESTHPEKVEHFGITTAEAMAYGVIPCVHGKGGQLEVLGSLSKELTWSSKEECIMLTLELLKNPAKRAQLKKQVRAEVHRFSHTVFTQKVQELFS